ncbi:MAG: hypothetical protein JJT96_17590 [Opitutales bacterium]|nr:hypothetical protein [Opitutales bacterium]
MMKKVTLLCGLAIAGAGLSAQTLFFESFDNTVDQQSITVLDNWNWAASDGGVSNTSNRQFGRLSAAAGVGGDAGFAYVYQNAGSTFASVVWYDGASFAQNAVTGLSAFVGNSNATNQVRFLIQIDNSNWYVSTAAGQTSVGAAGNFSSGAVEFAVPFSTAGANWVALSFDGQLGAASTGFPILQGDISGSALSDPLPSGNITAVGAYLLNANNTSSRFDNFTVIPEPSVYAALIGLVTLAWVVFVRRRLVA